MLGLLERGADVNRRDKNNWTPLLSAAAQQKLGLSELLAAAGADATATTTDGTSSLHYLVRRTDEGIHRADLVAVLEFLLSEGLSVDAPTPWSLETPLHQAAQRGNLIGVDLLLSFGANPNARDLCGQTPLHYAAQGPSRAIVERLIEEGADLFAQDNDGATPGDLARRNGLVEVVSMFEHFSTRPVLEV